MNIKHIVRQFFNGNIRNTERFAQNIEMEEAQVQEHLEDLEKQGIIRQLPQGSTRQQTIL